MHFNLEIELICQRRMNTGMALAFAEKFNKTFAASFSVCASKFLRMEAALRGQSHFANRIAPEASYFLPGQL
jgi:hypothetical protein